MKFVSAMRMNRTANHATAAMSPTSRIGSTASKMAAPASSWMISMANAMPAIQMNARSGGPSASTKLSSHTLGVRANVACKRAIRRLAVNASTAVARTAANTCTTHDSRPTALNNPVTVSVPFMTDEAAPRTGETCPNHPSWFEAAAYRTARSLVVSAGNPLRQ